MDTVVSVKGAKEAELAKLLENPYRHVNIALVNEMVRFCRELDIDLWEVGGHCIPIDPNYLSYEVKRKLGRPFRFIELAQEINEGMPHYVVERLQDALNDAGKPVRGSRVLVLGVTYKPNIACQRESPAKPIATLLAQKGAILTFHEPRVDHWSIVKLRFHAPTTSWPPFRRQTRSFCSRRTASTTRMNLWHNLR